MAFPLPSPKHDSSSNNRSLDCGLCEAIATFDQFFQPLGEACCRSPIDKGVIEAQGHAEVFTDSNLSIGDTRFRSYAAQGKINGMVIDRDAPARTFAKHSYCRHAHCPPVLLLHLGISST